MALRTPLAFWLVLIANLIPLPALADSKYEACIEASDGSNTAWNLCGTEWIDREDWRLNKAWSLLMPVVEPDTKKALLDEQRAWITFKDKSCLFYADGTFGREGTVLSYPRCRASIIAARAKELRDITKAIAPQ